MTPFRFVRPIAAATAWLVPFVAAGPAFAQTAPASQPSAPSKPNANVIQLTPPSVSFGRIFNDAIETRIVTVANTGPGSMKPAIELPANAAFAYELIETTPGRECQIFVTSRGPFRPGVARETLTIKTGLPDQPTAQLTVAAYIPEAVEVSPTVILLSNPADSKTATRRIVQIINRDAGNLKITAATCDDPAVKIDARESLPGRLYRLVLEFPAGYAPPKEGRIITVQTDPPRQPAIAIPIRGASGNPSDKAADPKTASKSTRPAMEMADQPAPKFQLPTTVAGRELSNAEIGMAPVTVLNFVAPNCGFCKRQLPKVEGVRARFEPMGVRFVNVSETMRKAFTQPEAEAVYDSVGSKLELAMDPGNRIGRMFKVTSFPTLFVLTSDGTVREVIIGAKANIDEILQDRLKFLLDGGHLIRKESTSPTTTAPQSE